MLAILRIFMGIPSLFRSKYEYKIRYTLLLLDTLFVLYFYTCYFLINAKTTYQNIINENTIYLTLLVLIPISSLLIIPYAFKYYHHLHFRKPSLKTIIMKISEFIVLSAIFTFALFTYINAYIDTIRYNVYFYYSPILIIFVLIVLIHLGILKNTLRIIYKANSENIGEIIKHKFYQMIVDINRLDQVLDLLYPLWPNDVENLMNQIDRINQEIKNIIENIENRKERITYSMFNLLLFVMLLYIASIFILYTMNQHTTYTQGNHLLLLLYEVYSVLILPFQPPSFPLIMIIVYIMEIYFWGELFGQYKLARDKLNKILGIKTMFDNLKNGLEQIRCIDEECKEQINNIIILIVNLRGYLDKISKYYK